MLDIIKWTKYFFDALKLLLIAPSQEVELLKSHFFIRSKVTISVNNHADIRSHVCYQASKLTCPT